jgi:hypothetical protein
LFYTRIFRTQNPSHDGFCRFLTPFFHPGWLAHARFRLTISSGIPRRYVISVAELESPVPRSHIAATQAVEDRKMQEADK